MSATTFSNLNALATDFRQQLSKTRVMVSDLSVVKGNLSLIICQFSFFIGCAKR